MPQEFEGDLNGAEFWGVELRGARFRDVDLTDVTISHALLVDVAVDAYVERVVINGVDVTAFVNESDRWYPLRTVLRASDPHSMRAAWALLTEAWAESIEWASRLPAGDPFARVDGEFSFVETVRHLVFAIDKWFVVPIAGGSFHPLGLPNRGSIDVGFPGIDLSATPTLAEALAVRADRVERIRKHLATVTDDELKRSVDVTENGPHLIRECLSTVFEEEFWHYRYAQRDLATLDPSS